MHLFNAVSSTSPGEQLKQLYSPVPKQELQEEEQESHVFVISHDSTHFCATLSL